MASYGQIWSTNLGLWLVSPVHNHFHQCCIDIWIYVHTYLLIILGLILLFFNAMSLPRIIFQNLSQIIISKCLYGSRSWFSKMFLKFPGMVLYLYCREGLVYNNTVDCISEHNVVYRYVIKSSIWCATIKLKLFYFKANFMKIFDDFVYLFVFNVPSTARSFRDGTTIYCSLRRT